MVHILRLNEMASSTIEDVEEYLNNLLLDIVVEANDTYDTDWVKFGNIPDCFGVNSSTPFEYIDSDKIWDAYERECKRQGLDKDNDDDEFQCSNDIYIIIDDDETDERGDRYNSGYKINKISSVTIMVNSSLMDIDGSHEYETDEFFKEQVVFDQPIIVANGRPYLSKKDEAKLVAVMKKAANAFYEHYN